VPPKEDLGSAAPERTVCAIFHATPAASAAEAFRYHNADGEGRPCRSFRPDRYAAGSTMLGDSFAGTLDLWYTTGAADSPRPEERPSPRTVRTPGGCVELARRDRNVESEKGARCEDAQIRPEAVVDGKVKLGWKVGPFLIERPRPFGRGGE